MMRKFILISYLLKRYLIKPRCMTNLKYNFRIFGCATNLWEGYPKA